MPWMFCNKRPVATPNQILVRMQQVKNAPFISSALAEDMHASYRRTVQPPQ